MNLITNAVDAMPNGGTLMISAETQGPYCEIKIADSGSGIPNEIKSRIFDPFFTTKEVGKGTGLGLHIVKGEIEKHQGEISVQSEVGKGTQFFIKIPNHLELNPPMEKAA
jgi:signal transduction histidine kinase